MVDFKEWSVYPSSDLTTELNNWLQRWLPQSLPKHLSLSATVIFRATMTWTITFYHATYVMTLGFKPLPMFFSSTINFLLLWSSFQPPARRKPMADTWSCNNCWIRIERSLYGTYHWERKGFGFPRRHWWQFKVHNLYGATQKCNNHSWWHRTLLLLLAMCTGLEVKGGPLPHLQGSYWSRD